MCWRSQDSADRPSGRQEVQEVESWGRFLLRERELRQISLEEIAQTTRVPLRMLQHIEDDHLGELPGEVFVRGFLKSYAKAVGLEVEQVLSRFGERRSTDDAAPAPI